MAEQVSVKGAAVILGMKEGTLRQQIFRGVKYGSLFDTVGNGMQVADIDDLLDLKAELDSSPPVSRPHRVKVALSESELKAIREKQKPGEALASTVRRFLTIK